MTDTPPELVEIFEDHDLNKDGFLCADELKVLLDVLGYASDEVRLHSSHEPGRNTQLLLFILHLIQSRRRFRFRP